MLMFNDVNNFQAVALCYSVDEVVDIIPLHDHLDRRQERFVY
mgnify:CR=1 FL=1